MGTYRSVHLPPFFFDTCLTDEEDGAKLSSIPSSIVCAGNVWVSEGLRSKVPVNILGGHVTLSGRSDAASRCPVYVELWGCEGGGE